MAKLPRATAEKHVKAKTKLNVPLDFDRDQGVCLFGLLQEWNVQTK